MRITWNHDTDNRVFTAAWDGHGIQVAREAPGRWRVWIDGARVRDVYPSPVAAMEAVAAAVDRQVVRRGVLVHALQPPPYGTWTRRQQVTA
jgi:hypothetical protein